jgi:Putative adhesin
MTPALQESSMNLGNKGASCSLDCDTEGELNMRGFKIEFLILVCGALVAISACNGILHATKATVRTLGHVGAQVFSKSGSIKETVETRILKGGDWQKLNVQNDVGKIRVVAGSKTPSITITKRFHKPENLEFKLETRGDTLIINGKIKTNPCTDCSIDLTLNVPENLEVQLHTDVGDVDVAGLLRSLEAKADVGKVSAKNLGTAIIHLQTDTGDIELNNAQGKIKLEANVGTVTAEHLGKSQLKMQSDTGDLTLNDVEGAVVLETSIAAIKVSHVRGSLNLHSDTGDVTAKNITFKPGSSSQLSADIGTVRLEEFSASDGIELEGQTNIGDLDLGLNGFVVNQTGELLEHHFTATRAGQNTAKVHVQTDTGSIVARVQ